MTTVKYTMYEITAAGHSCYAAPGGDIVCAAISCAFKMAAGMLQREKAKFKIETDPKIPFIGLKLESAGATLTAKNVIAVTAEVLKSLAAENPKYLQVFRIMVPPQKQPTIGLNG